MKSIRASSIHLSSHSKLIGRWISDFDFVFHSLLQIWSSLMFKTPQKMFILILWCAKHHKKCLSWFFDVQNTTKNVYLDGLCPSSRKTSRKTNPQENWFSWWSKHVIKNLFFFFSILLLILLCIFLTTTLPCPLSSSGLYPSRNSRLIKKSKTKILIFFRWWSLQI